MRACFANRTLVLTFYYLSVYGNARKEGNDFSSLCAYDLRELQVKKNWQDVSSIGSTDVAISCFGGQNLFGLLHHRSNYVNVI